MRTAVKKSVIARFVNHASRPNLLSLRLVFAALIAFAAIANGGKPEAAGESRFETVNGMRMHYRAHGEGPPVVLLHGFFGCASQWQRLVSVLSDDYRVIAPDLRSHGRSSIHPEAFTHRKAAQDVLALMDALDVGRFTGVGYSSGAATLLHAAVQRPERIRAMVISGVGTHLSSEARSIIDELSIKSAGSANLEEWRGCAVGGDKQLTTLMTLFNSLADIHADMRFSRPMLETIKARTLIVLGDRDVFYPTVQAARMHQAIPDSSLWIVPNAGHDMYFEPLDLFFERIGDTLAIGEG